MKEVVRADPAYRRRFLLTVVVCTLVGMAVVGLTEPYFKALRSELSQPLARERLGQIVNQLGVAALAMYLLLWAGALALLGEGLRIRRTGQFPPPGAKVLRDTPVVRGEIARMRATLLIISAALIGFCLVVLGLMGFQLALVLRQAG